MMPLHTKEHRIDSLSGPLLVSWQLTRDCDLACMHCCTGSAPGKKLADELDEASALRVAHALIAGNVPYVMLCGGEPLIVPHFFRVAEVLGAGGVHLKIETNGQQFDSMASRRLKGLPIRSVQISLDGDTAEVYQAQRAGGSLERAHDACRSVQADGLPLEVTFAPTRINIHETEAVIERALVFGAFRFNTGRLMRIGTAAKLWKRLSPDARQYEQFLQLLHRQKVLQLEKMDVCFEPFSMSDGLRASLVEPPATLLVMPNGQVKVAAALPYVCADLRTDSLAQAWHAYRHAWKTSIVAHAINEAIADEINHSGANRWQQLVGLAQTRSKETPWIN